MKKSTKKVINSLSKYIGHEIIRTKPAHGDWSYTSRDALLLVGFTSDGCIRYRHTGIEANLLGNEEYVLPFYFTDRNWITYKKALKAKSNELNKWRGKKIKRIRPTATIGDRSYMCEFGFEEPVTLVSASKYHMVIMHNDFLLKGKTSVLRSDFINPEDWVLAE